MAPVESFVLICHYKSVKYLMSVIFIFVASFAGLNIASAADCRKKAEAAGISKAQKDDKSFRLKSSETFELSDEVLMKEYKIKKTETAFEVIVERADAAHFRYDVVLNKSDCKVRSIKPYTKDDEGPDVSPVGN